MTANTTDKTLQSLPALREAGLISQTESTALREVAERYAIAVTPAMAALIDDSDPADPMARQFIPSIAELDRRPDERDDPIGDNDKSPVRGIVHRYRDRVLLKAVGICPVYCRFCFRREMVGPQHGDALDEAALDQALDYIAHHNEIWEVILTGGDPLILSPRRIANLTHRLSAISHVKVIRWHTRVPAVAPQMVTDELVAALASSRPTAFLALHANHPMELTEAARQACRRLSSAGISLVSQTVLLRGVNDDAETLEALMRGFVEFGIKPYYLHHPDLAPGTGHFRVPLETGRRIMAELRRRLSGLAMPTYVLDIPGAHGKVPVGPTYLDRAAGDDDAYSVTDRQGRTHTYRDSC
ncbi:MAG: lysine-2,3-aminomutase-like protein [Alphaproteobacteria bacterium]|nr:lysine-2,3-aminomutase-like protein [Alphaproteobacteria bacterium]